MQQQRQEGQIGKYEVRCSEQKKMARRTVRSNLTHTFRRASRLQHRAASCTLPSPDDASPSCRPFNTTRSIAFVRSSLGVGRARRLAWGAKWRGLLRSTCTITRTDCTLRTYLTHLLKIEKTRSPHSHRRFSPRLPLGYEPRSRRSPVHIRMPSRLGPPHAN